MSYKRRLIEVEFTLGRIQLQGGQSVQPVFERTQADTVKLSSLRISARIVKAGGASMGTAQIRIFGMTRSLMNQLSTLGINPMIIGPNFIKVFAGDEGGTMSLVYDGTISDAWADMNAMPDVAFNVQAHTGLFQNMTVIPPSSFRGSADAADILEGIAQQIGVPFENSGVKGVMLANPYFEGSPRQQAVKCVEAAGIEWNGLDNGVLAIWPRGGVRQGQAAIISPRTGMVGYPSYTSKGISLTTLFDPTIRYGSAIEVESDLIQVCGEWKVYALTYDIEAEMPNGRWFTSVEACRPWLAIVR